MPVPVRAEAEACPLAAHGNTLVMRSSAAPLPVLGLVRMKRLVPWAAFAALVEHNNGIFGGCWCMGFHPDDSRTDAAHNRAAKERRVRDGQAPKRAAHLRDGRAHPGYLRVWWLSHLKR